MAIALHGRVESPVKYPDRFFIGGKWVEPSSNAKLHVISPATELAYLGVAEAQGADIDRAVAAAREAFDHGPWPRMSPAERALYLRAIGKEVTARRDLLGDIWTSEVGVINSAARPFMAGIESVYNYYADLADTFPFIERHSPQVGHTGLLVREPVGVVAAIIPWNGPMGLTYKFAPALLAGCTIVLKSSPETPASGYVMAEIMEAIGLPPGVVNVVTAERTVSELLVRHPGIDKIAFTGSSAVGKRIASISSERLARYTLELGGKSAAVILEDYDVQAAAKAIVGPATFLTGQVCSSLTRLVVPRQRHDAFVEALRAEFSAVRIGDPFDATTAMGPLAMNRQRERVEHYILKGQKEGARLAVGGKRPSHLDRGFYIEPTVFCNVDNNMTIAREEIFGPVVSVIPAADEAEAIRIANDTVFGLNASVFTNDPDKAYALARQLRCGTVGHNGFRTDFSIAFGGFKQSGIGREGGIEGMHSYLEVKTVILDAEPTHTRGLCEAVTADSPRAQA